MKATDLMLGDLVKSFGVIQEVFMVNASFEDEGHQLINYRSASEFEPIPLTPEILDKNKFFQVGYPNNAYELDKRYYLDHYDAFKPKSWVLYFGNYMRGKVEDTNIKITYVHELQHALKHHCGIEMKIIL